MKIVIAGGGLAGAAAAYHCARAGLGPVTLCEREAVPGVHASGRSAAMLRHLEADPVIAELALAGAAFLAEPPADWSGLPLVRRTGSFLVGDDAALGALADSAAACAAAGVTCERWDAARLQQAVPELQGAPPLGAWHCAADGVIDVHGLLTGLLDGARRAGAEIRFGCAVERVERRAGHVRGVATPAGVLAADVVVDATGAWAGRLAGTPAGRAEAFTPLRRHLFHTAPVPAAGPGRPWVWDITHGLYFRPESAGWLCSPCDESRRPPGDPAVDGDMTDRLAEKAARYAPGLGAAQVVRSWAGLRTFAPDRRPVIGWDRDVAGLFWVAGLGGFGATTAAAIGALAAARLTGAAPAGDPYAPDRVSPAATGSDAAMRSSAAVNAGAVSGGSSPASSR